MNLFHKPKHMRAPGTEGPGSPEDSLEQAERTAARAGQDVPDEGAGAGARADERRHEDFFDLPPEEIADYRPAGVIIAPKVKLEVMPAVRLLVFLAVVTAVIIGIVWVWPSSDYRVPALVGRSLTNAMEHARSQGFEVDVRGWKYSETHSDGTVLSQTPKAMEEAKKGDGIVLVVSKGPRPEQGKQPGSTSAQASSPSKGATGTYAGRTVCIDPGNQMNPGEGEYTDPGQTSKLPPEARDRGTLTGNPEDLVNLDIAMKLKDLLEKDGVKVVMTRESNDVQLGEIARAQMASKDEAELLVSVHCPTSTDATRMGTQTIYAAENPYNASEYEKSKAAALFCQSEVLKSCSLDDLGANAKKDRVILNWAQVPAVQCEAAYLSNPRDDSMLAQEDFRWKVAWGLRNGIIKYFTNP